MHEVETGFAVVQAGVKNRDVPWHTLGEQVGGVLTAKEALVKAQLDWAVELMPMVAKLPSGIEVPIPDQFAVIRDKDNSLLGQVGSHYRPVQNYKAFELFDSIVASGEAKYETAWSLRGGKIVAITAKVPQTMLIGGQDAVDLYMVLTTAHDGTRALTMAITPVRVVCMNTLNMALGSAKSEYRIRHTESAEGKIQQAREALGLTFKFADEFQKEADRMLEAEFTKGEFERLVEKLVPVKDSDDVGDPALQTQRALIGTFESSKTIDDGMRYTKWGAYNAVAEYADWIKPMRGSKTKTVEEQRTENVLFGKAVEMKKKALELLKVGA